MRQTQTITLAEPFPLLDEGTCLALCEEATFAWARQWKKWMARLVMQPQNYTGRPYSGRLCKFLSLGSNPGTPHAGPQSDFRRLYVEVNGAQPVGSQVTVEIFIGLSFDISVETVKRDRNGKDRNPSDWYSVVREIHFAANTPTFQPANTSTFQHLNLPTQQHSNTPTLQHTLTPESVVRRSAVSGDGAKAQ
jgi:hypothetical protein